MPPPIGSDAGSGPDNDPAQAAFARVRATARSRTQGPRVTAPKLSSARPDDRDPQRLGVGLDQWVRDHGYTTELAVAGLIDRWPAIVGEHVAAHVAVGEYHPDTRQLVVMADSPEWALQLRYLLADLQRRIDAEAGPGLVAGIEVRGPGRRRTPGGWQVRTGRRSPRTS